jgi:hypothetical protein
MEWPKMRGQQGTTQLWTGGAGQKFVIEGFSLALEAFGPPGG